METYKKGYQLYTIREEMVSDSAIEAALHATKEMGYVQVESFGYMQGTFFGQSPAQFKKTIDSASLSSPSGHYMPMQLAMNEVGPLDTSTIAGILDAAEALNQKWVIIPWMSDAWRTAEGYAHLANYLKTLSSACQERGMIAAWHNHEFEFQPLEDGTVTITWEMASEANVTGFVISFTNATGEAETRSLENAAARTYEETSLDLSEGAVYLIEVWTVDENQFFGPRSAVDSLVVL